jgi:hypothetical protein
MADELCPKCGKKMQAEESYVVGLPLYLAKANRSEGAPQVDLTKTIPVLLSHCPDCRHLEFRLTDE